MIAILNSFFANITLIISFVFVFLKTKEYLVGKEKMISRQIWIVPLVLSLLSVAVMFHPLEHNGILFDLRGIPLFLISYMFGWRLGLIAIIIPSVLRFYFGGPTVEEGIMLGILMPYIVGALFHRKAFYTPPFTIIRFRHMLMAFAVNEVLRVSLMVLGTAAEVRILAALVVFELAGIVCIALMMNESSQKMLTVKKLERLSRMDSKTNLYNLAYFEQKVKNLASHNESYVIAMFDIDYFKQFNDTHGHPAGDAVLQTISRILSENMRKEDVYARYGGEEFILCFSDVESLEMAAVIAERLREQVEAQVFDGERTQPDGRLTISIGLSGVINGKTLDEAIEEADQALYRAKHAGRNQVAV
ncbi:GGDEF domain-containing protein [Planococcus lenghuensis]|uniref:GGDEF domain-containing protein n=1 Tax=Planococcus lenghuensis TaxID=2213202 RepID=A0A1Q2L2B6_9BACL|nr:diguanylate cyclase [Planococcus lenghuensis]AQQ54556.1 hypothetical protein B0X71_16565 [Planococcus lenghuensis]